MDRNPGVHMVTTVNKTVALRKESVDRNAVNNRAAGTVKLSLSARRAWIEIPVLRQRRQYRRVALRKESVDRNSWAARARVAQYWSLSARRAWIEIERLAKSKKGKERRSPQGERG